MLLFSLALVLLSAVVTNANSCANVTKHKNGTITTVGCPTIVTPSYSNPMCVISGSRTKPYPYCCEKLGSCSKSPSSSTRFAMRKSPISIPSSSSLKPKACMKTTQNKDGTMAAVGCPSFQLAPNSTKCRIPGNPNRPYPHCCEHAGRCRKPPVSSVSACSKTTKDKYGRTTTVGCDAISMGIPQSLEHDACVQKGNPNEPYPGCCAQIVRCQRVPFNLSIFDSLSSTKCMKTTKNKDGSTSAVGCPAFKIQPYTNVCRFPGSPNEPYPHCCDYPAPCSASSVTPASPSVPKPKPCMKTTIHKDGSISGVGCAAFQLSPNSTMCRIPGDLYAPYPGCCEHPGPCSGFSMPPTSIPPSLGPSSSVPRGCMQTTRHKDGSLMAVGCPDFQLASNSTMCRIPGKPNEPYPDCCEQPGPCSSNLEG